MYIFLVIAILLSGSDGKFSDWNNWSSCSTLCGKGFQSRERIEKFEKCYSELSERRDCNNGPCVLPKNMALNSSVDASSEFLKAFPASNIVDGNTNTDFYVGTCMQTNKDENPWVRIQLQQTAIIKEIVIYNRGDCCSWRLDNVAVYVGNDTDGGDKELCGNQSNMDGINMTHIKCCKQIPAKVIHITIPGPQFLSLCEVQVYGTIRNETEQLARGKNATMSSVLSQYYNPQRAIDGNINTVSVTKHIKDAVHWWRVDLLNIADVQKVLLRAFYGDGRYIGTSKVTAANDKTGENVVLCGIADDKAAVIDQGYNLYHIKCQQHTYGRYLQVTLVKTYDALEIREFQAIGFFL